LVAAVVVAVAAVEALQYPVAVAVAAAHREPQSTS
jgi:hypothetical protein